MLFELEGNHTPGREESRAAVLGSVSIVSADAINLDTDAGHVLDHGYTLGLKFCPELKKLLS